MSKKTKFELSFRVLISGTMVVMAVLTVSQCALAQQQKPNAALQARARFLEGHNQTGSIGNGYRPWSAWTYQDSARRHAEALNAYGQHVKKVPPATAKEHLDEIRKNTAAAKSEIAKFGDKAAMEADVKSHIDALTKHLTECEQICAKMEKNIGADGVDATQLCAHCSGLEEKLKAAEAEHRALLKKLGIEVPSSAADHAEHAHQGAAKPPVKKDK